MKMYEEGLNALNLLPDDGKPAGGPGDEGNKAEGGSAPAAAAVAPVKGEGPVKNEPKEDTVPLAALEAERKGRQLAEANVQNLTQHLQGLQNGPAKSEPAQDSLSNMSPDTVMTFGEVQQLIGKLDKKFTDASNVNTAKNNGIMGELKVKAEYSDYNDVISKNLVNVLTANPEMQNAIKSASEEFRPMLAYTIGRMDPAYIKQKAEVNANNIAERLQKNATAPGSINAASGTAAETDLSKVITAMSPEEFEAKIAAVKEKADV